MSPTESKWDYFQWLCSIVNADDPDHPFRNLMRELYLHEFTWTVKNDENRAGDALDLRRGFLEERGLPTGSIDGPCSVLEMMVALACRIEDQIMWNPDKGDRTHIWFWEMVQNLGLGELDDSSWRIPESEEAVDGVMAIFLGRRYSREGLGGLFPIPGTRRDMRKMEIWYQMNRYFWKRYGVEDDPIA